MSDAHASDDDDRRRRPTTRAQARHAECRVRSPVRRNTIRTHDKQTAIPLSLTTTPHLDALLRDELHELLRHELVDDDDQALSDPAVRRRVARVEVRRVHAAARAPIAGRRGVVPVGLHGKGDVLVERLGERVELDELSVAHLHLGVERGRAHVLVEILSQTTAVTRALNLSGEILMRHILSPLDPTS